MAEYSRLAKGFFTSTGAAKYINLPFRPDRVELINFTVAGTAISGTAAQNKVPHAWWDVNMGQGFAVQEVYTGGTPSVLQYDTVIANGISTFEAGQMLQYGARKQIVSATKANPAVIEVTGHGYSTGDVVIFQGMYSTQYTAGMPQIDGIPFTITVTDANHFTIPWNTNQSNYTALAASPSGAFVKKVLYPYLYAPGATFISGIDLGTTTTVHTTSAHNFVVGQEVAFRIPTVPDSPSSWGTTELNSLPNDIIPGSPKYGYVISVTDYNTFVVDIDSSSYTAYNSNVPVDDVTGLQYPQVVAVGDVNTGGAPIYAGSALYPPPFTRPIGTTTVDSINGPAIQGAFFNNTSQGFIIGIGAGTLATSSVLVGTEGDVIYWTAYLHDISLPS